jgi:cytoskeletal protein CcmA (bactofilin family)
MALKDFMSRSERMEEREPLPSAPVPTPPVARPAGRPSGAATCIDAATELVGKLRCQETIRIDGRLEGELHCEQSVIVGEGARLRAAIHADSIVISGQVEGDVTARRRITLDRTARVVGDLSAPGIVIEEGAKLEGRITIGSEERPAAQASRDAQAAPRPQPSAPAPAPAVKKPLPPPPA